jgi:uracil-DNA glycosylase
MSNIENCLNCTIDKKCFLHDEHQQIDSSVDLLSIKELQKHINTEKNIKIKLKFKVDQSWNIYDIATKNTPESWENAFKNADKELKHISDLLQKQETKYGTFFPYKKNIFKAFDIIKLQDVKCIFIGLEPYSTTDDSGLPMATGLALSVNKHCSIPKMVYSMYEVLATETKSFEIPKHGDLSDLAKCGILLLNISLTVKPDTPKSHSELWTGFTMHIIEELIKVHKYLPFVFFGKDCAKISQFINGSSLVVTVNNTYSIKEDLKDKFTEINKFLSKHDKAELDFKIGN